MAGGEENSGTNRRYCQYERRLVRMAYRNIWLTLKLKW